MSKSTKRLLNVDELRQLVKEKVEGVWEAAHDEKGHHYRHVPTGKVFDSVTTKLILEKTHLTPWAAEIAVRHYIARAEFHGPQNDERLIKEAKFAYKETRDGAGRIGTAVHQKLEKYLLEFAETGRLPDPEGFIGHEDARVDAGFRSGIRLLSDPDIIPISAELLVGDLKDETAGTMDLFCIYKGDLAIIDWKTSNRVSDEYALQLAAYARYLSRMLRITIKRCLVAHLSKDYDKCDLYEVTDVPKAYRAFKHLVRVYSWQFNGEKKLEEVKNKMVIA